MYAEENKSPSIFNRIKDAYASKMNNNNNNSTQGLQQNENLAKLLNQPELENMTTEQVQFVYIVMKKQSIVHNKCIIFCTFRNNV